MALNVYEIITDRIIKSLEQNIVPWRLPWVSLPPQNFITRKPYRGINVFLLGASHFTSPYFLTYKQALDKKGFVKKGEHSTPCVFWRTYEDKKNPKKRSYVLRYYSLFNLTQCEGIEAPPVAEEGHTFSPIEACQRIVDSYVNGLDRGIPPGLVHGGGRAFYSPSEDTITMPAPETFESSEAYYATLYHEMAHSSGHKSRLNRDGIVDPIKFASHSYSYEELIAETTSSFLCSESRILDTTYDNSVAYLQSWISKLRGDPKIIIRASGEAAKASDFILGKTISSTISTEDSVIEITEDNVEGMMI